MQIIGIDISEKWFDGFNPSGASNKQFTNQSSGRQAFAKWCPAAAHIVMEASDDPGHWKKDGCYAASRYRWV